MCYFEVVVLQFFVPPCCSSVELLWGFPVGEVLMVGFDDEGVFGSDKVGSPVY